MFKLDNAFLEEIGLGSLSPTDKNQMLDHIYKTLEIRVGTKLAEKMSNEQLDEFESYINSNDENGALKWLETNFPNYKQVVSDELDSLKNEIKAAAPQILAASTAAPSPLQPVAEPQQNATVPPPASEPTEDTTPPPPAGDQPSF